MTITTSLHDMIGGGEGAATPDVMRPAFALYAQFLQGRLTQTEAMDRAVVLEQRRRRKLK
jgi:hypothetical protein